MKTDVGPVHVDCAIVHTVIQHANKVAKNLFYSGLQIVAADRQSEQRIGEIVNGGEQKEE